jgi:hypothetical protein
MPGHYPLAAVRAHLHEMAGNRDAAIASYRAAARGTAGVREQRYPTTKAARLHADAPRPVDSRPTDHAMPRRYPSSGAEPTAC